MTQAQEVLSADKATDRLLMHPLGQSIADVISLTDDPGAALYESTHLITGLPLVPTSTNPRIGGALLSVEPRLDHPAVAELVVYGREKPYAKAVGNYTFLEDGTVVKKGFDGEGKKLGVLATASLRRCINSLRPASS